MRFLGILVTLVLVHSLLCDVALGAAGDTSLSQSAPGPVIILDYDEMDSLHLYSIPKREPDDSDLNPGNPVYITTNIDHDNIESEIDLNIAPSDADDPDLMEVTVFCSESVRQDLPNLGMCLYWKPINDVYYNSSQDWSNFAQIWEDVHKTTKAASFSDRAESLYFTPTSCGVDGRSFWLESLQPCNGTAYVYVHTILNPEVFYLRAYEVDHNIRDSSDEAKLYGRVPEAYELIPGGYLYYHPTDTGYNDSMYAYRNHTLRLPNVRQMTGDAELSVEFLGEGRVEIYREDPAISTSLPFIFEDAENPENTTLTWTADVSTLVTGTNLGWSEDVWVIPTHLSYTENDVILRWAFNGQIDEIRLTVVPVGVDLDIDSDNDNGTGDIEEDSYEDSVEADDLLATPQVRVPGKIIPVNNDDDDEDGVEDYLDGFDLDQAPSPNEDDDNTAENDFYPIVLKLFGDGTTPITEDTRIFIDYICAAPELDANGEPDPPTGDDGRPYLTSGGLRLWKIDSANAARDGNPVWDGGSEFESGNFVAPEYYYPDEIGMDDGYQVFYVEGIAAGEYTIKVLVDMEVENSTFNENFTDEVKVTVLGVDLDVDQISDPDEEVLGGYVPLGGFVQLTARAQQPLSIPGISRMVTLSATGEVNKIQIRNADKSEIITLPHQFSCDTDTQFWVEGLETSSDLRDITLVLTHPATGYQDRISLTVFELDEVCLSSVWAETSVVSWDGGDHVIGNPCAPTNPEPALVIPRCNVTSPTDPSVILDFTVGLEAVFLPEAFTRDYLAQPDRDAVKWSKISGPTSGNLNGDVVEFQAGYENPKQGGVYELEFELPSYPATRTKALIHLPLAGPDATDWALNELAAVLAFGDRLRLLEYESSSGHHTALFSDHISWIIASAGLDWYGEASASGDSPCHYYGEENETLTIGGVVIDRAKLQDMMWGAFTRRVYTDGDTWVVTRTAALVSHVGGVFKLFTPDSPATIKAYDAGIALADGIPITTVMRNYGYQMQEPGSLATRLWPSEDSYVGGIDRNPLMGMSSAELVDVLLEALEEKYPIQNLPDFLIEHAWNW